MVIQSSSVLADHSQDSRDVVTAMLPLPPAGSKLASVGSRVTLQELDWVRVNVFSPTVTTPVRSATPSYSPTV